MKKDQAYKTRSFKSLKTPSPFKRLLPFKAFAGGWLILLVVFWVIRASLVLGYSDPLEQDAVDAYIPIGCNIISGNGVSISTAPPFLETAYRMPGYSLFLGLFYCPWPNYPHLAIFLQILLELFTAFILYRLSLFVTNNKHIAILATSLFILYPFSLLITGTFYRSSIFGFFLVLSLYYFFRALFDEKRAYHFLFCIFITISIYIREDAFFYFVILLGIWAWLKRKNLKVSLLQVVKMALLVGLLLSPWTLRNYIVFQRLIPFTYAPFADLWVRGNIDLVGHRTQNDLQGKWPLMVKRKVPGKNNTEVSGSLIQKLRGNYLLPLIKKNDAKILQQASDDIQKILFTTPTPKNLKPPLDVESKYMKKYIFHYPLSYSLIVINRGFQYLFSSRWKELPISLQNRPMKLFGFFSHFLYVIIGIWGMSRHAKLRPLIVLMFFPYFSMTVLGWHENRYALPIFPLFFLGTAIGLNVLWKTMNFRFKRFDGEIGSQK